MTVELVGHVLLHAVQDAAKMLPFLFVAYLIIEWIERSQSARIESWLSHGGRWGFIPGALLGTVPQCGFSAMASNFYGSRVITLGTLMAVYLATSDEAIPIMLSYPSRYKELALLIVVKLIYALFIGFVIDVVVPQIIRRTPLRGGYTGDVEKVDCHNHDDDAHWVLSALKHTAQIFLYILLFIFLFGLLVELVGEARIAAVMGKMGLFQPVVAALFGLIPNCAASVLLTQLYLNGTISFGAILAGLCTNAGVGLVVLFQTNKKLRQNLFIVALLFILGAALGLIVQGIFGL